MDLIIICVKPVWPHQLFICARRHTPPPPLYSPMPNSQILFYFMCYVGGRNEKSFSVWSQRSLWKYWYVLPARVYYINCQTLLIMVPIPGPLLNSRPRNSLSGILSRHQKMLNSSCASIRAGREIAHPMDNNHSAVALTSITIVRTSQRCPTDPRMSS